MIPAEILKSVVEFAKDYFKNKPFTDLLLMVGICLFVWMENSHARRADHAHDRVREILAARDEAEDRRADRDDARTDKVIAALTGVKTEIKKTTAATKEVTAATAEAAKVIIEGKSDQ